MTDWSNYTAYTCRHRSCQDDCINHIDSAAAQTKQCWNCWEEHDTEELFSITNHLPSSPPSAETEPPVSLAQSE